MTEGLRPVDPTRLTDPARLAAVDATGLLDTPASAVLDDLATLATRLLDMPFAFVTLVDAERSYWKATIGTGIAPEDTESRMNPVAASFCQYLIATDGPVVLPDAAADPMTADNPSIRAMGVRAWAGYPVRSPEGLVLGSFCVLDTRPREFSEADLEALSILAGAAQREIQLRQALARAGEDAVAAAAESRRLSRLADASDRLSDSLDASQVLAALGDIVIPELGTWLAVGLLGGVATRDLGVATSGDPAQARVVSVAHRDHETEVRLLAALLMIPVSPSDDRGLGRVIATGRPEYREPRTVQPRLREAPHALDPVWDLIAPDATLSVPLISRGRVLGAMTVGSPGLTPPDRLLLEQLALRVAVALDNALVYADARRAVLDLQTSLMPNRPVSLPGIDIAARYRPSTVGALAGGDFHQVITDGSDLVMVLGDIEGHGMTSAARMGQLRAAVAALALEGHDPQTLLDRLCAQTEQILDISLATLLVARLDTGTRELTTASAGHPPVVIAQPGEDAYLSPVDPGPPLGVGPATYGQHRQHLPPGTTLVFYSDGLVERRDRHLDVGLELLRAVIGEHAAGEDSEALADLVLDALSTTPAGDDDIALLVVRT